MKPSARWRRWMLAGVLALLLVVVMVCETAGWPFLRLPLQHWLQNTLHRSVQLSGPFHLQLLGGVRLQLGGLTLAAPAGFDAPYLLEAQGLNLALRYRDLWALKPGEPYRIEAIRANQLRAYLLRHDDGQASWMFALDETEPVRPFPLIKALAVREGQAHVVDAITHAKLVVTFSTKEGAQQTEPASSVQVQGTLRQLPLEGALLTQGFLPIATQDPRSPPIHARGWLKYGAVHARFRGRVSDVLGAQHVQGQVTVRGSSLADVGDLLNMTLPRTPAFAVQAEVAHVASQWEVDVNRASIGHSLLSGQFVYDLAPETPMLSGTLKGARLRLADLAPAFGAAQAGAATAARSDKLFPDTALDFASYGRMNAEIDVQLDRVDLGRAFKQQIAPLKLRLILMKRKLRLSGLEASTAQGSLSGELVIDAHDASNADLKPPPAPDWEMQLALRDIHLEQWLRMATTSQPTSPTDKSLSSDKKVPETAVMLSGKLTGKAQLQGRGRSTADLFKTLDGQLALMVRQGTVSRLVVEAAGLDIAQAVGLLMRGDERIPLQCVAMGWRAKQGVLTPEAALMDTPVTTLTVDGDVNLGEEQLNLRLQASPKNFSPLTMRAPIRVHGRFVDPQVSVSKGPIAARVAGSVLLGLLNPFAAILPFLDPGDHSAGVDEDCQQALRQLSQPLGKH